MISSKLMQKFTLPHASQGKQIYMDGPIVSENHVQGTNSFY